MKETIQDRRDQDLVAEDLAPLTEGSVGGNNERAPPMAAGDEMEGHTGLGPPEGRIAHLVHDEHRGLEVCLELLGEAPCGLGLLQVVHQVVEGREVDREPSLAGRLSPD